MILTKYVYACGCGFWNDQKSYKKAGYNGGYIVCPVHGDRVKHRERICRRCDKIFKIGYRQNHKEFCDDCQEIAKEERKRERYQELKALGIQSTNYNIYIKAPDPADIISKDLSKLFPVPVMPKTPILDKFSAEI